MLSPGIDREVTPASGVLYLHGFNSGVSSPKSRLMRAACDAVEGAPLPCAAPQLSHRPDEALAIAEAALETLGQRPLLAGSSMGGFLVSCLAERLGLPAVVINPAVRPARLMQSWIGDAFVNDDTGERFVIDHRHHEALEALTPARLTAAHYLLLLGTADETLDCRDAFAAYAGCPTILHPGGDHGFSALADYLPAVLAHGGRRLAPGRVATIIPDA
ncbi:YqiA/YcfP family alpha/beta fold hydrolase [Halomonas sp. YLGW01]|uniref:YqiA/YcfP family alpha/beta fold hydrolase n=1 Tax=Halomonas sp. YLGW01 TaxID=2773308 RepID=UPI0017838C2D|nr:YqiA/YcfP family alpha/beta fold hydrolase [Halomonas sp. YLGW01]